MFNHVIGIIAVLIGIAFAVLIISDGRASPHDNKGAAQTPAAAVILTYFSISDDIGGFGNIGVESFQSHMDYLKRENVAVIPLPDALQAIKDGRALPDPSVVITFEDADRSFLLNALPVLERYGFAFTVLVSLPNVGDDDQSRAKGSLTPKDLKKIEDTGLANFGLHGKNYRALPDRVEEDIKRDLNTARTMLRDILGQDIRIFAYPFGSYREGDKTLIEQLGFTAALGQHSGVAHQGSDFFALPRFSLTERYGDLARLEMIVNTRPLPVTDITPKASFSNTPNPAIGFTLSDHLVAERKGLACFMSAQEKPKMDFLNASRVELRLPAVMLSDRVRINCTMPAQKEADGTVTHWRWLGFLIDLPSPTDQGAPPLRDNGFSSAE